LVNLIVELAGALSIVLGLIIINFLLMIYISVKKQGGSLERRHILVISAVAAMFFLVGAVVYGVGGLLGA
jgi:hypothetical protein